ncbi:MAG: hypothetical protein ABIV21_06690, partial [Pyrinomonadaceae bacterium]
KYRQERLKAEREYRENYSKMGFPSPEERDRQREKSRDETEQLSAKLRAERLEQERLEAYREVQIAQARQYAQQQLTVQQGYQDHYRYGYGYGYGYPIGSRYYRRHYRQYGQPQGYFAGGQFWPSPIGTHTVTPRIRVTTRWAPMPRR